MDFRNGSDVFKVSKTDEVWGAIDTVPYHGVARIEGDLCYFNSYSDASDESPLYLFSFVDEDVIRDIKNSRVELLSAFTDPSAHIFKEVEQEDGSIDAVEVKLRDLSADELPDNDVFLDNA